MNRKEFQEQYEKEFYLGDGLYAHFDGYHIVLRAPRENGDHTVSLEPQVFNLLVAYRENILMDAKEIFNEHAGHVCSRKDIAQ